ncbi:MAG TPA: hypothetical protein VKV35_02455 [Streptosporangiaceae bacterium]|nr:hypothetical protein [Streptosporangiaceae bacterium]
MIAGPPRPAAEPEQLIRLARFRAAHPQVTVGSGTGYWQAVIAEDAGEIVVTRWTLAELLDRLGEVLGGERQAPGCAAGTGSAHPSVPVVPGPARQPTGHAERR